MYSRRPNLGKRRQNMILSQYRMFKMKDSTSICLCLCKSQL